MTPVSMAYEMVGIDQGRVAESAVEGVCASPRRRSFFRSADGQFHASVPLKNRHEIFRLKSTAFRDWLIASYRCRPRRGSYRLGCSPRTLGD